MNDHCSRCAVSAVCLLGHFAFIATCPECRKAWGWYAQNWSGYRRSKRYLGKVNCPETKKVKKRHYDKWDGTKLKARKTHCVYCGVPKNG